jgi:hypothetical protein
MSDHGSGAPLSPLTDDLQAVLARAGGRPISIGDLVHALGERGTAVLAILMAAPFVLPVPLPGLSLPFGVALMILGIRLGLGRPLWLPGFILRRPLQPATLANVVRAVERVARPIEKRLKPRWESLTRNGMHTLAGGAMAVAAVMLMPPVPIPGLNAIPALAIVLFALGLLESDGRAVAGGYVVLLGAFAYFYFWWDVIVRVLRQVWALVS